MLLQIRRILNLVGKIELSAAVIILGAIVAIILSQVFSRYVLGKPLIWAEELATYLLIWLGFVAASVAYKLRRHIAIQTFQSLLPETALRISGALIHLLILVILTIVIWYIPDAMRTERMQSTVGLPINVGLHWFFTVPTLVSCLSMGVSALFYATDSLFGSREPLLAAQMDPSLNDDIIQDTPQGVAEA
jgi:TRAP-type C4-dicarboxylate transport system permease small subunit